MASRDEALKELARRELARRQQNSAPAAPPVDVGADMLASGKTGLRQGIESGLGSLSDAAHMNASGDSFAAKLLSIANPIGMIASGLPTTEQIHKVTAPIIGENYEPKTTQGEYARTVGQFAPAVLAPGGPIRKLASAVIPALTSETAGQVTKGSALEPYARMIGGLLGGLTTAGNPAKALVKSVAKDAASGPELKAQTDALYGKLRQAGIEYDANEFAKMANDLPTVLHKANVRPVGDMRVAFAWAREVKKLSGKSPDFEDINSLRSAIGGAARDASRKGDKEVARALDIVQGQLNDFETSAPLTMRGQTPTPAQRDVLNRVRGLARNTALRNIKSRTLDRIEHDAETYAGGKEAGIRQGLRNLAKSKNKEGQAFTDAEREVLLDVANGRKAINALSRFGVDFRRVASSATVGPAAAAGVVGSGFGALPGMALLGAGTIARPLSGIMTNKALERASAAIRSGKLTGKQSEAELRRLQAQRRARLFLSTMPAVQ